MQRLLSLDKNELLACAPSSAAEKHQTPLGKFVSPCQLAELTKDYIPVCSMVYSVSQGVVLHAGIGLLTGSTCSAEVHVLRARKERETDH